MKMHLGLGILTLASALAYAGDDSTSSGCAIGVASSRFSTLVERYVPNGANNRGSAAAIYQLDSDGDILRVLFEKNSRVPQAVASTQKVLTAFVGSRDGRLEDRYLFESLDLDFDEEGGRGVIPSTGEQIEVGDRVRLADYLNTLLVQSSNGSAQAIAHGVAGTARAFMSRLNATVEELLGGVDADSYFQNPHGLTDTDDHYRFGEGTRWQHSTANNMARLLGKIMSSSSFRTRLGESGLAEAGRGTLRKTGTTNAAGKTAIMRFPLPDRCGGQAVAMAFFGDSSETQHEKLRSLTSAVRTEVLDSLGALTPEKLDVFADDPE